jgi:glycosyltransferase involved in cell wall biosynthesis
MRVLYVSTVDISVSNGPGANEREFTYTLNKLLGNNAHFVIPTTSGVLPHDVPKDSCTFILPSKERHPIHWIRQQFSIVKNVGRILREREFDIIVIRAEIIPIAFLYFTRKTEVPYALKTAGSGKFNVFKKKGVLFKPLASINHLLFQKLINGAIMADVVSPTHQESLGDNLGNREKIVWIDNGVNTERFMKMDKSVVKSEMGLTHLYPIIGYAGNLAWERGGLQIIESLPAIRQVYPNAGALILGSGEKMSVLYTRAKELGVYDSCVFTQQVPFDHVVKYINCMDIGVSQLYEESQGASEQKVRQYIACGLPVIVSPGAVNQFVPANELGYIVDPHDHSSFSKAVLDILGMDETDYKELSAKARKYAEDNLSYESRVLQRLGHYKKLLNK